MQAMHRVELKAEMQDSAQASTRWPLPFEPQALSAKASAHRVGRTQAKGKSSASTPRRQQESMLALGLAM